MIKTFRIDFVKLFLLTLVFFFGLFFIINNALAQSASPQASATTSTSIFPIKELGECSDLGACTKYCEDPINYNSCSDYAKKNGFYKDDQTTYGTDKFYQDVKKELGCDSKSSCFDFCSKTENFDLCNAFAKRNQLPGGYTDEPDKPQYIEAAKNSLGCDSTASCVTFCDNPANAKKCSDFANQVGLSGGTTTEGPGGCQTPGTCGAYCSDPANYVQCSAAAPGGTFAGPGGCNSEASCRSYCDQNPDNCRSYSPGTSGIYVPVQCLQGEYHGPGGVCTATGDTQKAAGCVGADKYWDGNACQDKPPVGISTEVSNAYFEARPEMGNCQTPGECFDYCKENPGKCGGFDANVTRPTDNYTPYLYYTPGSEVKNDPIESMGGCTSPATCYDFCKENPGKCSGFSGNAPRPPEIYIPGTYYTPPADIVYVTPPTTNFYTTPVYYTPPQGSTYTTPQYYTPGMYSTPSYQTPPSGSNYTTPNYYTPWANYPTPNGQYPTPTYTTPQYYTPPAGSNYTTPYYYTPPSYNTPYYFTPGTLGIASNYTTPSYTTPPPYSTPQYYTPYSGSAYTTPVYFTPPSYSTPTYYTPPAGSNYTSPSYYTPPTAYTTPRYYTPGTYPTPIQYATPNYPTPQYFSPPAWWVNYPTPNYPTPTQYSTPTQYYTPPQYSYPTPGGTYSYTSPTTSTYYSPSDSNYVTPSNTYYVSPSYLYPTPGGSDQTPVYGYPTPGSGYTYPTPNTYYYPTPSSGSYGYPTPYTAPSTGGYTYPTPSYMSPSGSYGTPSYSTPSYGTPSYGTPTYETPSYGTPSYGTPSYGTPDSAPPPVQGASTVNVKQILQNFWNTITAKVR